MTSCFTFDRDVWILTAQNQGFERYVVGVFTSAALAEDALEELNSQLENPLITSNTLFKRK